MYDKRLTATDESARMVKVASDETDAPVKSGNCESSGINLNQFQALFSTCFKATTTSRASRSVIDDQQCQQPSTAEEKKAEVQALKNTLAVEKGRLEVFLRSLDEIARATFRAASGCETFAHMCTPVAGGYTRAQSATWHDGRAQQRYIIHDIFHPYEHERP